MAEKLEGKVWRYGDNIDTDVIIPARYLNSFDPKELASHCMVDIDETFAPRCKLCPYFLQKQHQYRSAASGNR